MKNDRLSETNNLRIRERRNHEGQFRILFHAWQKAHGIDYDCKGVAMRGFVGYDNKGRFRAIE